MLNERLKYRNNCYSSYNKESKERTVPKDRIPNKYNRYKESNTPMLQVCNREINKQHNR